MTMYQTLQHCELTTHERGQDVSENLRGRFGSIFRPFTPWPTYFSKVTGQFPVCDGSGSTCVSVMKSCAGV